jgi:hypothetical protein
MKSRRTSLKAKVLGIGRDRWKIRTLVYFSCVTWRSLVLPGGAWYCLKEPDTVWNGIVYLSCSLHLGTLENKQCFHNQFCVYLSAARNRKHSLADTFFEALAKTSASLSSSCLQECYLREHRFKILCSRNIRPGEYTSGYSESSRFCWLCMSDCGGKRTRLSRTYYS